MAGAFRAVIDWARLDRNLEALGAELRRGGRAEQAIGIGADSMSLAAVAAVLGALLDAAIDGGVLIGGIVLAAAELGAVLTAAGRWPLFSLRNRPGEGDSVPCRSVADPV